VNNCFKLVLVILLTLLVKPLPGLGQQAPTPTLESLVAAARQAEAAHDYAAAETAYKQAVRIEPNMPELWANLGLMQQEAGDIASAIPSFQQANHLNPSLYVPDLFLGIDLLRTGKPREGIPFLIKAEKINKTDPQAPLELGRAYYATGKFSAAAQEFTRVIALNPTLGAAWFSLGIARLNQIEADAHAMSGEFKDSPFAGALYAQSLEKQARFSEAATVYRSLLSTQPQPPCLHSDLGFALLRHRDSAGAASEFSIDRTTHPECSLALLGQARIAIDSNNNDQAVKLLEELWQRDHSYVLNNPAVLLEGLSGDAAASVATYFAQPSTSLTPDLRAALLAAFNGSDSAQDAGSHAEDSAPASSPNQTAEQYYRAGDFTRCTQRLSQPTAQQHPDKLRLLAACSFFAGDNDRTIAAATALQVLQPHSPEALYWSIQANQRLALKSLARFQQLDSDSAKSHVLLGDIYDQLERYDDALAEYNKALGIAPGDPAALLGLATAYLNNNNLEQAAQTAQAGLARAPQDPELNLIVAEALVTRGHFADAEPFLMKSLNSRPQSLGHVHALIGKVYAETGRTQQAISQLKLAESSDENGSIHYLLARLYRESGDTKDAVAALEKVKIIKQQQRSRGVKTIEDPELSSLESPPTEARTP